MPIALVTGPANAGKARVLLEAVRGHVARGAEPLLVVPTEADQVRYRRELAEGGTVLGARVERFEGLLAEVCERSGDIRAPLGALARERVLARIADARPGMASELARLVSELQAQRVTPARLRGALGAWSSEETGRSGERAMLERLCTIFERYQTTLAKMRRADRELRTTRALDELRRKPALWGSAPVLLYGFDDFTELQVDTILTLGGIVGAAVTVSLAFEAGRVVFAGRASTFQRLAPFADAHTELAPRAEYYAPRSREALHHLERSLLSDDAVRVEPGEAVRLLEGGTPRAELELVAGQVRALLDDGVPAEEIAIVHRSPESIAGLIGEVLEDFDIPYARRRRVMFARTALGRGLLGILHCAVDGGELGDLLGWLGTPGALVRPELLDRLEARARAQGVLDGAGARALWEVEQWPLERIDRLREAVGKGTHALIDALMSELRRLFCAPRSATASVLDDDELDDAHALTGARHALEELRELARAAPELAPSASETIEVLERLELSVSEHLEAGRVAVVDPLSLRARRVRMVFACGLQEGVFPAPATPHPLLDEQRRRALAHASGLVLRGEPDALAAERYLLYALASRPEERLTLSWHIADEEGTPLARSLFVEDVCDLFSAKLTERTARRVAGAPGWPGPGRSAGAMARREAGMRAMPSACSSSARVPARPIAPLKDERVLGDLGERVLWSASSLESWTACPVKWFVERLLRAEDIEPDPEALARGSLAHAALKDTLERLRERTGSARLTPASVGLAKRLLHDALLELEASHPLSVVPERLPGARRRLQVDLGRYLEHAAEQASPLEPTYLELEFGFEGEAGDELVGNGGGSRAQTLAPLELGEGVLLRGRIDRVDLGSASEAVVYDYKGRFAPPGAKWVGDGAFQLALYMRAVEVLLDRTAVGGFYQPLAGRDIRARGVLDGDSGLELDCVRTDRFEHEELRELIDQCVAAALRSAAQARSGALEPRPDTCAYNGGCAYPTICRCER
ncbi:MAG TPA: PD-(D/E)XK nuclease family protein [Solirubrobacteraceae bacterium]|jgi:ATP-dependent helicase/DNAse subunit B|nr:PD-(D/E)XK nuclease family protein [Solirubrobacteraceae bacterium]